MANNRLPCDRTDETSLFPAKRKLDPDEYAWLNSKSKGFVIALAMHSHHVACHRGQAWLKLQEMVSELRGVIETNPNLERRFKRIYQLIESEVRATVKSQEMLAAKTNLASAGAIALHSKPGGSWDKRDLIRAAWTSGKYTSRDICAEQECAALGMSFSAARKALRCIPDPT
jgi:hypothetical protein